ncbi:MAG TPA: site-specific DNA-methyltransferase [Gemmataceae bacterium]|nr:site-specific DNA-methyltransferase [Gemmataceae bacterium]
MQVDFLFQGDCLQGFSQVDAQSVDLVFADPPFNIGYDYDAYDDRKEAEDYLSWCNKWGSEIHRVLKPNGSFWLAIGDDFAAELKVAFQAKGFHCRSWVVWYYTFGVNCTKKFSRSHTHLFHFVKNPKAFTFNAKEIKVPSARQLVYADSRAKEGGRLPDDTWFLRPQDLKGGFTPEEDVWYFPRVCGTFKERAGWHGCQMPEQLLGRIIKVSSNPGELVLDPFAGSGTTLVVAKKLGRRWIGFELSKKYAGKAEERLAGTSEGEALVGSEDPVNSAPTTANGKRLAVVAPPMLRKLESPRQTK